MTTVNVEFQQTELRPKGISEAGVNAQVNAMLVRHWTAVAPKLQVLDRQILSAKTLSVCQRFVTAAESQSLNMSYRRRNQPTNVLSFFGGIWVDREQYQLGDLAVCSELVAQEAQAQGKSVATHHLHLVIHGILHLVGYDHEVAAEAKEMETLEAALLSEVGVSDPYKAVIDE